MGLISFPDPNNADEHGLVAIGGNLDLDTLVSAYSNGIFPWPISHEAPLTWFSPNPRGILVYSDLHISKSLAKFIRKTNYQVTLNNDFPGVINACATSTNRSDRGGTWITPPMIAAYINLHKHGLAISAESYLDGELIGGIYGVLIGNYFSGESMFYKKTNGSKLAMIFLLEYLAKQGIDWIDTQMLTPVIKDLGGKEISRAHFLERLKRTT